MRGFPDWVASRAQLWPHRAALVADGRTLTFAALDAEVTRLARRLATLGVGAGDRVATLLRNGPLAAMLPFATLRLDATLVPLNTRLAEREREWQLQHAKPRLLLTADAPALDTVVESERELRMEHAPDDVLAMIYTSGTTGHPKGAMLTVGNFWWNAIGSALNMGIHRDDRWLACLPLFHVGGLAILVRSAIYGTAVVVHEGFDAAAVNASIDAGDATIVSLVPVMLERMLEARQDAPFPATLRAVLLGGAAASEGLIARCVRARVPVMQTYGLTEATSQVATISLDDARARPASVGKALYPNEIRIAAPAHDSDSTAEGEILVRGPVVMAGYEDAAATARAIQDGWLHTGDIGRLDGDGFLYVLDRRDDLIVTGGENVYPAEVESVLQSHPGVAEAAVVGVPDQRWGQRAIACVRLSAGPLGSEELTQLCRRELAGYKVPSEFRFVSEPLPRTASGKLRRSAVRAMMKPGVAAPRSP